MQSSKKNIIFLTAYTLFAVLYGIAIVIVYRWRGYAFLDECLYVYCAFGLYAILFYPRIVFHSVIVISSLVSVGVLCMVSMEIIRSSLTETFIYISILSLSGEVIYRAKIRNERAVESLTESENRYAHLIGNLPVGVYRNTPGVHGKFLAANPALVKIFGYDSLKEFMATPVSALYEKPEERKAFADALMKQGRIYNAILRLKKKDGTLFWANISANAVLNSNGEIEFFDGIVEDVTERKQLEDQFRESKEILWIVLDSIPARVFWKDLDSTYLGCNKNFAHDAGVESPKAIAGKNDYDLPWKKEEADFFRECDRRVMDSDTPEYHIVESQHQAGGKQAWVETNKIPLHNDEGNVTGIIGTYEDITERINTERELRLYREQLEELVERRTKEYMKANELLQKEIAIRQQTELELKNLLSLEEAVSQVSRLFATSEGVNLNEVLRILGETVAANRSYIYLLRGNGRMDNTHEWCATGTESQIHNFQNFDPAEYSWGLRVLENDNVLEIVDTAEMPPEARYEKTVFQSHDVRALLAVPIRSYDRRFLGFMGFDDTEKSRQWQKNDIRILRIVAQTIASDLERKRVTKRLNLLNSAVEQSSEGLAVTDLKGNILYLNEAFAKMHGYEIDELLGKNLSIFHTSEQLASVESANRQTFEMGRFTGDVWHKKRNGDVFPSTMNNTLLHDEKGNPIGLIGTLRDITALKQTENELRVAKELAETASRAKSQFLANMSHELRTPLYGMLGMIDLLSNTPLNTIQLKYADKVRQSGESLLEIINDVLDFSKIEAGKMSLEETEFDIRQTVENSVDLFANHAFAKDLSLSCLIDPDIPPIVRGDPVRLRQILSNLVVNAIKFTYQGGIQIRVVPIGESSDVIELRFDVSDTGIGIAQEHQQTIFDSFTQADGTTTKKYGGTGLGLAISKQLAEMMGGTIGLESELDRGSTFWFTVRIGKTLARHITETISGSGQRRFRALIVNSSELDRTIIKKQLSSWEVETGEVSTANEALDRLRDAALRHKRFDIVIFGMNLPDTDGLEFARTIKYDLTDSHCHLLMLTSLGTYFETEKQQKADGFEWPCTFVRQSQIFQTIGNVTNKEWKPVSKRFADPTLSDTTDYKYRARVLIAEDTAINLDVTEGMLKLMGCTVDVAINGQEAVEAAANIPYDIVFMDCQMPVMDGYEATASIRQNERLNSTDPHRAIVVGLTAYALKGDKEKCLAAGMDDYLSKPFGLHRLSEVLDRWISHKREKQTVSMSNRNRILTRSTQLSAHQSPPTSSIDWQTLNSIQQLQTDDDPDILLRAISNFIHDSSSLIRSLKNAIEVMNLPRIRNAAHSLKSASSNVGALKMTALCKELENENSERNMQKVISLLESEYDLVHTILKKISSKDSMG